MKLQDYLSEQGRGSLVKLAGELGVSAPTLYQWAAGIRPVPPKRCVAIELATAGKVTRKDFRPNDWADHWPELAQVDPFLQTR